MSAAILVVEDDPSTLELVALGLEDAGYRALRAASAEEAETRLAAELPDGLSILMPVYNERDTIEEMIGRVMAVPGIRIACLPHGKRPEPQLSAGGQDRRRAAAQRGSTERHR